MYSFYKPYIESTMYIVKLTSRKTTTSIHDQTDRHVRHDYIDYCNVGLSTFTVCYCHDSFNVTVNAVVIAYTLYFAPNFYHNYSSIIMFLPISCAINIIAFARFF